MDLETRLSYLFGTNEAVKHRRQMVLLREKMATLSLKAVDASVICSGSLGEGVAYPRSDDDIMYVYKNAGTRVYDNDVVAAEQHALYMIPSVYSPGFCLIEDTKRSGLRVVSSTRFRTDLLQFVPSIMSFTLHGPCVSNASGSFEFDHVFCFWCPSWPAITNEWVIRRRRYRWPSHQLVDSIVRGGCHVVPIGNQGSSLYDLEWRVSFSLAERTLIHSFNHVQFLVYSLMKLILKKVIDKRIPNVLCSYFMKTVLFYAIENTSQELWISDTIEECYRKCLLLLYHFIKEMNCPSFFVPANNMMRRKVNADNKVPLLYIVADLLRRGIVRSLLLCDCEMDTILLSRDLNPAHVEFNMDVEFITGYLWQMSTSEYQEFAQSNNECNSVHRDAYLTLLPIVSTYKQLFQNTDCALLNLLFRNIFSLLGLCFIRMPISIHTENKSSYQILQRGQRILNVGYNADISSGRLQLANCMFLTGRYHHCLRIINDLLSKLAPYVMSRHFNLTSGEMYMGLICSNGYPITYKIRRTWALDAALARRNNVIAPLPVKMLLTLTNRCIFRPRALVYAYFLQGLCFYNLHDIISMNNSLTSLQQSVRDTRLLEQIFYGKFLLGYMTMLQKDYHSSCRYLTSAYLMTEDLSKQCGLNLNDSLACSILLACLLKEALQSN